MGQEEFKQGYGEEELINYLGKYITAHKKSAIDNVLAKRTRFFTIVLEDIFKPHNASAVLRTCDCFGRLRSEGYTIYGTSPASNSLSIHDFPILPNQKVALVFGNEHEGISEDVKSKVDGLVHIPMRGFTESFNISVSASIFLYELIKRVNDMKIPNFNLTEKEQAALRLRWYKLIVPHADIHERYFRQQIQNL